MNPNMRSRLVIGILLILGGGIWLACLTIPEARGLVDQLGWPAAIILSGGIIIAAGILSGAPDLAIPGSIIAGLGAILYWQNLTHAWESWAYIWTLFPGFAGAGEILAGLFSANKGRRVRSGLRQIVISSVLFLLFGSFLGGLNLLGKYWPVLLIASGLYLLLDSLLFRRSR